MNGDAAPPSMAAVASLNTPGLDVCGACQETVPLPVRPTNRPGLRTLSYRIGTHGSFRRRMLAHLPTEGLPAVNLGASALPATPDGGSGGGGSSSGGSGGGGGAAPDALRYPLAALTTRADDDPAIALVDAWATVGDVLTFYQERIANEGYLLTATERRSVLELARAIGYELNPGVAASAFLAFTVEDAAGAPGRSAIGEQLKVQSIPGQDERPQTFETVQALEALATRNALRPQTRVPQTFDVGDTEVYLRGIATQVQPGDALLLCGTEREAAPGSERWDFRIVQTVEVVPPADAAREGYTRVTWQPGLGQATGPTVAPAADATVYVFRQRAALFGHNAPDFRALPDVTKAAYDPEFAADLAAQRQPDRRRTQWPGFEIQNAERNEVDLDAVYPRILVGSWIALSRPGYVELYRVTAAETAARTDFTLSAKVTCLTLDTQKHLSWFGLRDTVVFAQTERLERAERPLTTPVQGDRIVLSGLAPGLQSGQALALTGKAPGAAATDPPVSEVAFVQSTSDDGQRTTITLSAPLQGPPVSKSYDPVTLTINANVVLSTHGETVHDEVLGSGAGALANQRFALKKPPLTYVSAPTPSGAETSLAVRVDDVRWDEVPSLFGLGPSDQRYIVRLEDDGTTRVIFGDGQMGARLPTGVENVRATYRSGIGPAGNVPANRLALMLTRPLGVRGVTNPLPAAGGTAPEQLEQARRNAPLTVLTLDRIVSLRDYEDFAHAFAGVGKAQAARLWDGRAHLVYLTVAGAGGARVEDNPVLLDYLLRAMAAASDPIQPVRVQGYEERRFGVTAELLIDPRLITDDVLTAAAAALQDTFSFDRRGFGQAVTAAEIIAVLQGVSGVQAVDLNDLYLVPTTGTHVPPGGEAVPPAFLPAAPARVEHGLARKAELLLIDPAAVALTPMRPPT